MILAVPAILNTTSILPPGTTRDTTLGVGLDPIAETLARGAITVDGKDIDALASRVAARFEQRKA